MGANFAYVSIYFSLYLNKKHVLLAKIENMNSSWQLDGVAVKVGLLLLQ